MKALILSVLFAAPVAFADYIPASSAYMDWKADGVYGSADDPIDGGVVLVPYDVTPLANLTAYVKPGEKLIFVGTMCNATGSASAPFNRPIPFVAGATIQVGSGHVEFQCPVTAAGDLNFSHPGGGVRDYNYTGSLVADRATLLYDSKEKATVLFENMKLADFDPRATYFDSANTLAYGLGSAYAIKRGTDEDGDETLSFQLQEFDQTWTKTIAVTLFQDGEDVKGYATDGWYAAGNVVGLDFTEITTSGTYGIRTPEITREDTYGIGVNNLRMTRNGNSSSIVFTRALDATGSLKIGSGAYVVADGAAALATSDFQNAIDVAYGGTLVVRNHDLTLSGSITGLGAVRCEAKEENVVRYVGQNAWNSSIKELSAPGRSWSELTNATCWIRYRCASGTHAFHPTGGEVGLAQMRAVKIERYRYQDSYDVNFIQFQAKIDNALVVFFVFAADVAEGMQTYDCAWGYRLDTDEKTLEVGEYFDYNSLYKDTNAGTGLSAGFNVNPLQAWNVQDFTFYFKDREKAWTAKLSGNAWITTPVTDREDSCGSLDIISDGNDTMTVMALANQSVPRHGRTWVGKGSTLEIVHPAVLQNPQIYVEKGALLKESRVSGLSASSVRVMLLGGTYQIAATSDMLRYLYMTPGSRVTGNKLVIGDYNSSYFTYASGDGVSTIESPLEFQGSFASGGLGSCVQHIGAYPGATLRIAGSVRGSTNAARPNYDPLVDRAGTLSLAGADGTLGRMLEVQAGTLELAANGALTNDVKFSKADATLACASNTVNTLGTVTLLAAENFTFGENAELTIERLNLSATATDMLQLSGPTNVAYTGLRTLNAVDTKRIRYNGKRVSQDAEGRIWTTYGMVLILR